MVKVLPFYEELPMPPLVKVKKEESSHSRVFEPKRSEDRSPRRPNGQLEELSAAFKLTRPKTRGLSANNEVCPSVRVDRTRDRG